MLFLYVRNSVYIRRLNFVATDSHLCNWQRPASFALKVIAMSVTICDSVSMGVDHGGTRETRPPRIWSRRTLVQIVPLRFFAI